MLEKSRIAFMYAQSASQSSNAERLYSFCQGNPQFFAYVFLKGRRGKFGF